MVKQKMFGRRWYLVCFVSFKGILYAKNFKNLYLSKNWGTWETFLYMEAVLWPTVRMITQCSTYFEGILRGYFADLEAALIHYSISIIVFL